MTLKQIDEYLENKLKKNNSIVKYTFYEVRVKQDLKADESLNYIHLVATKLENLNYKVYRTGQEYSYKGKDYKVDSNELLVAIKKEEI